MNAMYQSCMNMHADASWSAPAYQSAQYMPTSDARTLILDTAILAVSFLILGVRICLLGLVRIILPNRQS